MQDEYTENRAGDRLRASIDGRGWSLADFSRRCGVPYRSIQDYVAGKSKPGFEQLTKFALSGIDVSYVLTGRSFDQENNPLPNFIDIGDIGVGKSAYSPSQIEPILARVAEGFELRDWINIWTFADDWVPPASHFDAEEKRRQAAVTFIAAGVVLGLIERTRALGWLSR